MFAKTRNFLCTFLTPPKIEGLSFRPAALSLKMECNTFSSNASDNSSLKVIHDPEAQEFKIEFPNSQAFLEYEQEGNLIKIMHTEVPKELGGRGIGKILAKAALIYIDEHKYHAETHCDYVRHYIEKYDRKYLKYLDN